MRSFTKFFILFLGFLPLSFAKDEKKELRHGMSQSEVLEYMHQYQPHQMHSHFINNKREEKWVYRIQATDGKYTIYLIFHDGSLTSWDADIQPSLRENVRHFDARGVPLNPERATMYEWTLNNKKRLTHYIPSGLTFREISRRVEGEIIIKTLEITGIKR